MHIIYLNITPSHNLHGIPIGRSLKALQAYEWWPMAKLYIYIYIIYCLYMKNVCIFSIENFNLWRLLLIIASYYQTKTLIGFWYKRRLNTRSLIQPSEILPIKLTETHKNIYNFDLTYDVGEDKMHINLMSYVEVFVVQCGFGLFLVPHFAV